MTKRLEFSPATKRKAYELRGGKCPGLVELHMACGKDLSNECEYDHIKRCEIEPDNSLANCRPLCRVHHAIKTAMDAKDAARGRNIRRETKKSRRKDAMRGKHFPKGAKINSRSLGQENRSCAMTIPTKPWKRRSKTQWATGRKIPSRPFPGKGP